MMCITTETMWDFIDNPSLIVTKKEISIHSVRQAFGQNQKRRGGFTVPGRRHSGPPRSIPVLHETSPSGGSANHQRSGQRAELHHRTANPGEALRISFLMPV